MSKITQNFSTEEFRCKCGQCEEIEIDPTMVLVWQMVRDHFDKPVRITSGYRCLNYNRHVGSRDTSMHIKGRAGDGQVEGISPKLVYEFVDSVFPNSLGLGVYDTFVHIDSRIDRAYRWGN